MMQHLALKLGNPATTHGFSRHGVTISDKEYHYEIWVSGRSSNITGKFEWRGSTLIAPESTNNNDKAKSKREREIEDCPKVCNAIWVLLAWPTVISGLAAIWNCLANAFWAKERSHVCLCLFGEAVFVCVLAASFPLYLYVKDVYMRGRKK